MSVIAARRQTAGRGQRGNTWSSQPCDNLTFTIVLKFQGLSACPPLKASSQFAISQAAALAVTDYLASRGLSTCVKWPNDIYSGDRKICGILIENSIRDGMMASSIIGIGLNLNQTAFPPDLPNPTSLAIETGLKVSPEEELPRLIACFRERLGHMENLGRDYLARLYRLGVEAEFVSAEGRFTGKILGVADDARLIVEEKDGATRLFAFKEIQYII